MNKKAKSKKEEVKEVQGLAEAIAEVVEVTEDPQVKGPLEEALQQPVVEMIQLSLSDVNNFMLIVDAVLIEDVRASVVLKHFTKMLIKHNPQLTIEQK